MPFTVSFSATKMDDILSLLDRLSGGVPASEVAQAIEGLRQMSTTMQSELDELRSTISDLGTVRDSVRALAEGIPARIDRAVADALAKGATPEQLAAFDAFNKDLRAGVAGIVEAVTQGTSVEGGEPGDGTDTVSGGGTGPGGDDTAPGGVTTEPTGETPAGDTVSGG
jgi:hypothetical protein